MSKKDVNGMIDGGDRSVKWDMWPRAHDPMAQPPHHHSDLEYLVQLLSRGPLLLLYLQMIDLESSGKIRLRMSMIIKSL